MSELGALSLDYLLGGRVRLWQPVEGYRAGVDPVLLAASIEARAGHSVLELGCGAGAALCCLGVRIPGLTLSGLELQPAYADLARRNLSENAQTFSLYNGSVASPPAGLKAQRFDRVIANPPYFEAGKGLSARDAGRDAGRSGNVPLSEWVGLAFKRTKPGGVATFIQRAERLPDLLVAMTGRFGSIEVLPLLPRAGRRARLVLVRGKSQASGSFVLHAGVVMHPGSSHGRDGEGYTGPFEAIFREGASLPFGGEQVV